MTSNARATERILGSLRSVEGKGVVRMEDRLDAAVGDVWSALTDPRRLAVWLGEFEGDLRPEAWEPPRRLLLLTKNADEPGEPEHAIEATLTADGGGTMLVWEERGMPPNLLAAYGAGVQVHVEVSPRTWLAGRERCDAAARFDELFPAYQRLTADVS